MEGILKLLPKNPSKIKSGRIDLLNDAAAFLLAVRMEKVASSTQLNASAIACSVVIVAPFDHANSNATSPS
jgi:hypothetical protein